MLLLRKPSAAQETIGAAAHGGAQHLDRQLVGQHHDPGSREHLSKGTQVGFVRHRLATDHQVRRSGGLSGVKCQLDRVELGAHFEAGAGQQMLQALAEQSVRFDQDGLGRGHGGFSPKALVIERARAPRRWGRRVRGCVGETLPGK